MTTETFDRQSPRYRLFIEDDGAPQWWTVEADNTPGRALDEDEAKLVQGYVDNAPWKTGFYTALAKHRKATVYDHAG